MSCANGKIVYIDVRGNNQNRTMVIERSRSNANELLILPFMVMLDGGDDLQTGLVFAQNMYVKQNQASFGSLNSYSAKLFNVSDDMEMLVNGTPLIGVHDDGSGQAQNSASFNHLMQFGKGNEVRFRVRKGPYGQQFTNKNFTYGMEIKYGSQVIYHYLDGQRNALSNRPAGAKWNEEALIGQPLLDQTFLVFQ